MPRKKKNNSTPQHGNSVSADIDKNRQRALQSDAARRKYEKENKFEMKLISTTPSTWVMREV